MERRRQTLQDAVEEQRDVTQGVEISGECPDHGLVTITVMAPYIPHWNWCQPGGHMIRSQEVLNGS